MMMASLLTGVTTLTRENQIIMQFLAIKPDDPLYIERFLAIRAFDNKPAVPSPTSEANQRRKTNPDRERDFFAGDNRQLIQQLREVQAGLAQGTLPQPPYLVNHPRRGYHHPLPMSPDGIPVEFLTLEDSSSASGRVRTLEELLIGTPLDTVPNREAVPNKALEKLLSEIEFDTVPYPQNESSAAPNGEVAGNQSLEELLAESESNTGPHPHSKSSQALWNLFVGSSVAQQQQ